MKHIRETDWMYRYMYPPISRPQEYPHTIIIRHGITPSGKKSKYWATICRYGVDAKDKDDEWLLALASEMHLPKLPKGYTWSEPFLF